jgi:hypothetical protein
MIYKRKKYHFLLLEVMIAFTLVFCFTFPLIRKPYDLFNFERKKLLKIEKERIAVLSFTEILEKLYKKEFSSKDLNVKTITKAKIFILTPFNSIIGKSINRKYKLIRKTKKNTPNNNVCKKMKILLFLEDKNDKDIFEHYFIIEDSDTNND